MADDDAPEFEEQGYVIIAGTRCPIVGTHYCSGAIGIRCVVPAGFPGCTDGVVTIFGHDDQGIMQLPEPITMPAVPASAPFAVVELGLTGG